jgi:tetratricopeptide (TPR) repeat protein
MQGNIDGAQTYFGRSLVLARSIGDRRGMIEALDNLGYAAQVQEDYQLARQYLEEGIAIAEAIGNRPTMPVIGRKLALVFEKLGDFETTQEYLMRAIEQAIDIQAIPICLQALADLARIEPDAEQAVQWADFVLNHEATRQDAREIVSNVIERWSKLLGDEVIAKYQKSAAKLTLETLFA